MRKALPALLAVGFAAFLLTSCGDSTGPEVSGLWTITEIVNAADCGDGIYTDTYTMTITQSGNDITVLVSGLAFTGTLEGNRLRWSGSYPEEGGIITANVDLTISDDGNSLSGSSSWTYTDGLFSCSGTTQVSGVKN